MQNAENLQTNCCIVGGGPAGIMLGCLLARAGIPVIVLEKHADFFRDFRGDTIHPSTLQNLFELGILDQFLKLPHQQISQLILDINGRMVKGPDVSHLPVKCPFIALAPQWDFLNFMADYGHQFPSFQLRMNTQATELIQEHGRVTGVVARTPDGKVRIKADLVVAADGRHSDLRQQTGLALDELGVPIDVLWYRLPRESQAPVEFALGHLAQGKMMVTLNRGDYFQCATVIPKGEFASIQAQGLPAFREVIGTIVPELKQAAEALQSWDQVKLLTVQMNRLRKWWEPGLLLIGDAAHAMSPVGGVGVNLAIQDAVATANLLAEKLKAGTLNDADLAAVQQRREWPAKMTQRMQAFAHRRLFDPRRGFGQTLIFSAPARSLLGLVAPVLRRVIARVVGLGFRPEHVEVREEGKEDRGK